SQNEIPEGLAGYFAVRGARVLTADSGPVALDICRRNNRSGHSIEMAVFAHGYPGLPDPRVCAELVQYEIVPALYVNTKDYGYHCKAVRAGARVFIPASQGTAFLDKNISKYMGLAGDEQKPVVAEHVQHATQQSALAGRH